MTARHERKNPSGKVKTTVTVPRPTLLRIASLRLIDEEPLHKVIERALDLLEAKGHVSQ
jgi:hypothetical protein